MEEHARRRAPSCSSRTASRGFVLVVLVLAAATFALWARLDPARALDHAVALLIVTCPCALGLATPLAVSAAIAQAARAGLLIKGADVLEKLTRPGRMWLDKTGTLTTGRAALVEWWGDEDARPLVAAVEAHSAHPLARAFVAAIGDRQAAGSVEPVEIVETQGAGIEGRVGSRRWCGSRLRGRVERFRRDQRARGGASAEGCPVLVAVDGRAVALAAFGDPLRDDARAPLDRVGLTAGEWACCPEIMPVVAAAGQQLGVERRFPRARLSRGSSRWSPRIGTTAPWSWWATVNDAAALAAATVGRGAWWGRGGAGRADVYITRPGVGQVADLLDGAHRTMGVVRRNLIFSLLYNAVGVSLAMAGLLNPVVAAVLMPLSSLTVIVSSYRARTFGGRSGEAVRCR